VQSTDPNRIVNYTLQGANLRNWRSHTISQDAPQHAIYLDSGSLQDGVLGRAQRNQLLVAPTEVLMGPPILTSAIRIDKEQATDAVDLAATVAHEVGHGVGLPHHGRTINERWQVETVAQDIKARAGEKLLIAPGGRCTEHSERLEVVPTFDSDGKFLGCLTALIVIRGAEHSGVSDCPMRYRLGEWFFGTPTSSAETATSVTVARADYPNGYDVSDPLGAARVYEGQFFIYDNEREDLRLGKFCVSATGTGLNTGDDVHNHARDTTEPCAGRIVVNDTVFRGVH
jgi:hypothetical protein